MNVIKDLVWILSKRERKPKERRPGMENLETETALGTNHITLTNKNHNKVKKMSKTDQPRMDNPEMDISTRATSIYSM